MSISQNQPLPPPKFFTAGVDLGQKQDHSAVAVVEKRDRDVYLVHIKQFRLGAEYGSVLGYLRLLSEKLRELRRILIDQTGVGEVFVEEAIKSGLKNARGVMLSLPKKQEIMTYLKQQMQDGRVHIPYDREFLNELNVERYELTKTGQVQFSHPQGTHDDRLWAFALAVYEARPGVTEHHYFAVGGRGPQLYPRPPKLPPPFRFRLKPAP